MLDQPLLPFYWHLSEVRSKNFLEQVSAPVTLWSKQTQQRVFSLFTAKCQFQVKENMLYFYLFILFITYCSASKMGTLCKTLFLLIFLALFSKN